MEVLSSASEILSKIYAKEGTQKIGCFKNLQKSWIFSVNMRHRILAPPPPSLPPSQEECPELVFNVCCSRYGSSDFAVLFAEELLPVTPSRPGGDYLDQGNSIT